MNLFKFFKKEPKVKENGNFAEFFLHATPKEKIEVFTKAAQLANEDQRKLMEEVKAR